MKTRIGFVSNSSTTSFCIYGAKFDDLNEKQRDEFENLYEGDFGVHYGEDGEIYLGRSPFSIKDDETGIQFKESVQNFIKSKTGKDVKCGWHKEAYRNG